MDVIEAIKTRRSVKVFDSAHRMTEFEIRKLMSMTMLSPTAFNIQNWRFVVVRDVELRQRLREVSWNQTQVTDASALFVVCADLRAWGKNTTRYWRNAPSTVQEMLVRSTLQYYADQPQRQRDEAMRSCGLAAMCLMLAAKGMGYDSCAMTGFDVDAVGNLINLPADHVVCMFVTVGKALQEPFPRSGPIAFQDAVVYDRFDLSREIEPQDRKADYAAKA